MKKDIVNKLEAMAEPLAESIGLSIWGIEIISSGRPTIRIFVEGESGTAIDKCAELSRLLGLSLDVEEIISGPYSLEISSPGLERQFFTARQMQNYVGETVNISLLNPEQDWPGRKKFQGTLKNVDTDKIILQLEDCPADDVLLLSTSWQNIQRARLVHDFNKTKGAKRSSCKARS